MFAALAIGGGFFVAAGLTGTAWEDALRITMYAMLSVGAITLAVSYAMLMLREPDGKAPFSLVALTYAFGCLGITIVAVLVLVAARILGFAGGVAASQENEYSTSILEQVMYGGIGGSAVAVILAAAVFAYGLRTHQIRRRIPATPLAAIKEMFRRRRR